MSQPQREDNSISENRSGEASTTSENKEILLHPRPPERRLTRLFCKTVNKYKEFNTWRSKVLGRKRMVAIRGGNGGNGGKRIAEAKTDERKETD